MGPVEEKWVCGRGDWDWMIIDCTSEQIDKVDPWSGASEMVFVRCKQNIYKGDLQVSFAEDEDHPCFCFETPPAARIRSKAVDWTKSLWVFNPTWSGWPEAPTAE